MRLSLRFVPLFMMLLLSAANSSAQLAVGTWRDHIKYASIRQVQATPTRIYAASALGLCYYDLEDYTLNTLSKSASLNDVGISTFAYDPKSQYLVVAYTNSNIDLIYRDHVYNLSDIKRGNIPGDKTIYHIRFNKKLAYLSCGFGLVVVDLDRREIKETYYLGEGGGYCTVYDVAFVNDLIVASTSRGLLRATASNPYLNIADNWHPDTTPLMQNYTATRLEQLDDHLLLLLQGSNPNQQDLVEQVSDGTYVRRYQGDIRSISITPTNVVLSVWDSIILLDHQFHRTGSVTDVEWANMQAHDADLSSDGTLWVAHDWAGLLGIANQGQGALSVHTPGGPNTDNAFRLIPYGSRMYLCPGGHRTTYSAMYLPANVLYYQSNEWHQIDQGDPRLPALHDIVDLAIDPNDSLHWAAAAWECGIVDFQNNELQSIYNADNTDGALIPYSEGDYSALFTGGVAYDKEGNLWVTNSLQQNNLAVHRTDGTWQSFNTSRMVKGEAIDRVVWDSIRGYKWFYGRPNKIFVHDGENRMAYVDPNNGSKLETYAVNCVTQDHDGNLWIGTNKGIKVIYDAYKAFDNGGDGEKSPVTCSNILFYDGTNYEYLMAYENITCIAVDGANRKWVGTAAGGLYLISAQGTEQLEHFTAANSPLFSDKIATVAVHRTSGEVFIGTDKGLQGYRGTATAASYYNLLDIHAFPNPVRPDYDGPVAIKGFSRNARVHITDASGHVVYTNTATGGQVVWNQRTHDGTYVASGTYFVFASDENGQMRAATKILIIR